MKRFALTTLSLICASAGSLCADDSLVAAQMNNNQQQTDQQQMQQKEQDRQHKQLMMNMITPEADPYVKEGCDFLLTADFIWWKAQEDGLNYAFDTSLNQASFKYKPGFKVGAGLKFARDGWDVYAQYTWLRSNTSSSTGASSMDLFVPTSSASGVPTGTLSTFALSSASASWKMHLNALDLELGRNFWVSKWLTVRPFVGFKLAFNDQKFNVTYNNITGVTEGISMKLNQRWAIGLRGGLNTAWYVWKCCSIYADLAIAELWNDLQSTRTDTISFAGTTLTVDSISTKSHSITPVLEMGLGFRYETMFHCDQWMFFAQAGWEEQVWFNQNQFIFFTNSTPADLSFEGLTVKLGFYF